MKTIVCGWKIEVPEVNERCVYRNVGYNINHNLKRIAEKIGITIPFDSVCRFIQTSVYSMTPAIHDKITKVHNSLCRTLVNLEHLLEVGIDVSIATPIMSQNKDEIGKIIEYTRNKNIGIRANANIIEQKDGNKDFVNKYALSLDEIRMCYTDVLLPINRTCTRFYNMPAYLLRS